MLKSRTLRRMPKVTRKYAKIINELELITRRLKNLTEDLWELERDSQALWKIHDSQPKDEVDGHDLDEVERQMLSAATKRLPS